MIIVNGNEFRTLEDKIYVNNQQVREVWSNGTKVYPDIRIDGGTLLKGGKIIRGGTVRLKSRGPIVSQNNLIFTAEDECTISNGVYGAFVRQYLFTQSRDDYSMKFIIFWNGLSEYCTYRYTYYYEGNAPQAIIRDFNPLRSTHSQGGLYYKDAAGWSYAVVSKYEYITIEGMELYGTYDADVQLQAIRQQIINDIKAEMNKT